MPQIVSGFTVPAGSDPVSSIDDTLSTMAGELATAIGTAGGRNLIINGAFDVWQRGTSISLSSGGRAYGPDRFMAQSNFSAGSSSLSQQAFTLGAAPVAGYEAANFLRLTAGSTASYFDIGQKVEDVRTLAGQSATVSFWAKASVATTTQVLLQQNFGSGGSASVDLTTNVTVGTSWQRYTFTTTLGSMTGKTIGAGSHLGFYLVVAAPTNSQTFDLWGVQLEAASTASTFRRNGNNPADELIACQRYYVAESGSSNLLQGYMTQASSTARDMAVFLPVTMRVAPTVSVTWAAGTGPGTYNITPRSFMTFVTIGNTTTPVSLNSYTASAEL